MEQYKIGKIVMSKQALIILITGLIVSLGIFTGSLLLNHMTLKMSGVILAIVAFGMSCYYAYVTNCTLVGKCVELSWVLVVINVILILLYWSPFFNMIKTSEIIAEQEEIEPVIVAVDENAYNPAFVSDVAPAPAPKYKEAFKNKSKPKPKPKARGRSRK